MGTLGQPREFGRACLLCRAGGATDSQDPAVASIPTPVEVDAPAAVLHNHQDQAMVAAMVFGGLRRCGLLGLQMEGLRVGEPRVFTAEGKGGHQRLGPGLGTLLCRRAGLPRG
jgi:hypothetical protein